MIYDTLNLCAVTNMRVLLDFEPILRLDYYMSIKV